uniref:Acyl--binding domain-containing protein 4-like n=1 Tax=Tetraselmis sp. GSL018 TaxID=582737 RepID=A0A061SA78_9CHLO
MTAETMQASAQSSTGGCTLPYPERFKAAVHYISNPPAGSKPVSDDTRLLLYALNQQATIGPCKETKPWGWNVVETAKWQTWSQLGNMSAVEAMRLYVRELEENEPDWYAKLGDYNPSVAEEPVAVEESQTNQPTGIAAIEPRDEWIQAEVSGARKPPPRYEHAMAAVDGKLLLVGGNCGGRYLNDVWILDLSSLEWVPTMYSGGKQAPGPPPSSGPDTPPPPQPTLPPSAGHAVVPWASSLLAVGGLTKAKHKSDELVVHSLETRAMAWSLLEPSGTPPPQLGGHTATIIGSCLYVFGGEDNSRRLSDELFVLDLESMVWSKPETKGRKPSPRCAHVAAGFGGRYLLIFGGGSVAHCYQDLHVLDVEDMSWSVPAAAGQAPSPRAGHAAAMLGNMWYIAGGGNNTTGCRDMVALDVSELGVGTVKWSFVTKISDKRSPIVTEGLSLTAVPEEGAIVAFGGYNGKYHNAVHVFKPAGAEQGQERGLPAPPAKSPLKEAEHVAAERAPQKAQMPKREEEPEAKQPPGEERREEESRVAKLEAACKEAEDMAREAAAARESAAHELALMRRQLVSAQNALAETERGLEEARASLGEEQSKNFKLEVEVAELRQKLGQMEELEKELEHLRRQAQEAKEKKGSGLWGYIAG